MVRINNFQNTQEYSKDLTQQTPQNEKASIFLVDDGDNKFGVNDIQGGIKFDKNAMTEFLREYIEKPFEEVKDNVLNKINEFIHKKNSTQLPQETIDLITESVNELIEEISSDSFNTPQGINKADIIKFLSRDAVYNPPAGMELPTDKNALKSLLMNVAMASSPLHFSQEQLENKLTNIRTKLKQILPGREFDGPNGIKIKGETLLDIINNKIGYEHYEKGAGRFDPESKKVLLNLDANYVSNSDAELMRLVLHEALHCAFNTPCDTQEEERLCESQAIRITAEIVNSEKTNNNTTFTSYQTYGQNIEDFSNNQLLDNKINEWINTSYSNYPKTLDEWLNQQN